MKFIPLDDISLKFAFGRATRQVSDCITSATTRWQFWDSSNTEKLLINKVVKIKTETFTLDSLFKG